MLSVAALAVLLAGGTPVTQDTVQGLPSGRRIEGAPIPGVTSQPPVSIEVGAGWTTTRQTDPFGRTGPTSFVTASPIVGARLRGQSWYAEFAGQMVATRLTNRNVTASVSRDIFASGRLRWGLGIEFADVRFRHEDFRVDDVMVGTNRAATIGLVGLNIGIGPYAGRSVRFTALGGYYKNRYGSVIELPGYVGDESLADDTLPVVGAKVAVDGITVADRVELGGSVRYLRLSGRHGPSLTGEEFSGTLRLDIRLFRVRGKSLFVGGFARFGPSRPSIITDKTFGLRGTWKLR